MCSRIGASYPKDGLQLRNTVRFRRNSWVTNRQHINCVHIKIITKDILLPTRDLIRIIVREKVVVDTGKKPKLHALGGMEALMDSVEELTRLLKKCKCSTYRPVICRLTYYRVCSICKLLRRANHKLKQIE